MTHQNIYLIASLLALPMLACPAFPQQGKMSVKFDTLKTQVSYSSSQPLFDLQKKLANYSAVSPQASAMMERIKCPVDYNTGAVNVSIPLYEIKMRDLSLPIVLKCKTTGIKTNEDSGCVGLGWSLQAEPMISREVKGKPDERFYTTYNPNFGSTDIMYLEKVYYGDSFDEEPDIFYYSNLNNNGQFVLRRPKSYSDPTYNPVLIPAGPETFVKSDFNSGGFRMKDAKGNLYYYGDNSSYTEYTSNSNGDNPATCWKASRIISPRNDTISFTYAGGRYARYPANLDYYGVEDMDGTYREHGTIIPTSGGYWKGVNNYLDYYYANGVKYESSKSYVEEFLLEPYIRNLGYGAVASTVSTKILNTITYPNGKLVFSSTSGRITSMQIYEKSILIKEISFYYEDDYNYESGRYRLTGVAITDKVTNSKQTYSFDYYSGNTYSPYSTKAVDYWGFYNGKESNTDLVPRQEISMEVRYIGNRPLYAFIGGADRTPNIDYAKTYTLRGITYPTGAREQFEYELNKYKSGGVVKEAGGLRIQRISTYNHLNNQTEIRTFQYGLNGDESGRICFEPNLQYFCSEHQRLYIKSDETAIRRYRVYSSQSAANLFYSSGSPVLYVDVVERRGMPEKMVRSVYHYNNDAYPNPYPGKFYPDQVIEWRFHKLLNRKDYLGDGEKLLKNTDYGYTDLYVDVANHQSEMRLLYGYNIVSWHSCPTDYDHYYFQDAGFGLRGDSRDVQATVTETDYSEGTPLVNSTKLSFGGSEWSARTGLPNEIVRMNSDSTIYVTSYKYPYHYASGTPEYAVAQRMIQNNDVSRTFEESYSIGTNADVIKKLKYNFGLTSNTIPYQLNSLQISHTSATDMKDVERYTRYDERGNLTEYVRQDGCTVTILWGYNYQLPIAEIVGANYATVSSKISSYASLQMLDGTTLQSTLNAIRNGLPAAMVTTYTYYPGRGLATQTAPNGKITTYEYSGGGELLKQKDANGKTVESYEYKYYQ